MSVSEEFERTIDRCMKKYEGGEEFIDLATYAKKLIDLTINDAVRKVSKTEDNDLTINDGCPGCEASEENEWPTSSKMSVRDGLRCVKKMMKKWKTKPAMSGWKFYAEFVGLDSDGSSDFYNYQVRWSVPTKAYPEPQVTVSVFFTVEATKIKYPTCPVEVTYIFEGNQFPHRPTMAFRPKWIYDVLDIKTIMFRSFKF